MATRITMPPIELQTQFAGRLFLLDSPAKILVTRLKTTKGIERNLFAKKFLSNIFYSPESIKIRFNLANTAGEAAAQAQPAPPKAGLVERTLSSENFKFVSFNMAGIPGLGPMMCKLL